MTWQVDHTTPGFVPPNPLALPTEDYFPTCSTLLRAGNHGERRACPMRTETP